MCTAINSVPYVCRFLSFSFAIIIYHGPPSFLPYFFTLSQFYVYVLLHTIYSCVRHPCLFRDNLIIGLFISAGSRARYTHLIPNNLTALNYRANFLAARLSRTIATGTSIYKNTPIKTAKPDI